MMTVKQSLKSTLLKLGFCSVLLMPLLSYASFIESTIGTAVVNDATASYYNPAALVLVKNPQIIPQGTVADFHSRFTGNSTPLTTGITDTGSSTSNTRYLSPSFFAAIPVGKRITLGLAVVTNSANRDVENGSVLRYVQSNNSIQDYDIVPAVAIKINDMLSIGGGVNFSHANFDLKPITGFPGTNIADSQSNNISDGMGVGGNAGFLLKPSPATLVGFNYRSMTNYQLSGTSTFDGTIQVVSNQYHYKMTTPARSVLSINHFFTPKLGLIGTVQRIQWSSLTNVHVYGIAGMSGDTPVILNGTIPYYLQDAWVMTLGTHYRITPEWIVRVASTYNQSPGNPHYQVVNGDSIALGASMGYVLNPRVTIDGSYAHVFMKNQNIDIPGGRYAIQGVNEGARNAASLKLTFNL